MQEHDERHSDVWYQERDAYCSDENDAGCMLIGWAAFTGCDHENMSDELMSLSDKINIDIVNGRR